MKPLLIIIFQCLTFLSLCQVNDNFADGNYTNNPAWSGDTAKFEVVSEQLHLNAPAVTDEACLATASGAIDDAVWEFYVEMHFNPSSGNYSKVYLVSDKPDFKGSLNGYYVRIGYTDDEVSLFRQTGESDEQIIDGTDNMLDKDTVRVKVKVARDASGNWELFCDTLGGSRYFSLGTAQDTTHYRSNYFGVFCDYTSTRSTWFYFDDFIVTGTPYLDSVAPELSSLDVLSSTQLKLTFNEALDTSAAHNTANYIVDNGIGVPSSAKTDSLDQSIVFLDFSTNFTNGLQYTLTIQNMEDEYTNAINTTQRQFMFLSADTADFRDVVINEILPDPFPPLGLPDGEFIELYNRSSKIINLEGWTFSDATSTTDFDTYWLLPDKYVIICPHADTVYYKHYGDYLGISSFPSLNNAGDDISIADSTGKTIDFLSYSDTWFDDEVKEEGGYSLEQANPFYQCSNSANWKASNDVSGGTPGRQNSVYDSVPDTDPPVLQKAYAADSVHVSLYFNEILDTLTTIPANISIDKGITVDSILTFTDLAVIHLKLAVELQPKTIYTVTISHIADCEGNPVETSNTAGFVLPEQADSLNIIINEVLFNPRGYGSDFVEIYNNSAKYIDLQDWKLAKFEDDSVSDKETITALKYIMEPGEYVVITEDTANIIMEYPSYKPGRFIQAQDVPSYNNEEGNVILVDNQNHVSDRLDYTEDMHFALLDPDGVSLERISFDRPSNEQGNWSSASENSGFATPGYKNSQYYDSDTQAEKGSITRDPEVFSPDNDGYHDVLNIHYRFDAPGYQGSITIFDANGRLVRKLAKSDLLGNEGTYTWNGITDTGEKAVIGIYVIYFEAYDLDGNLLKLKETCVLSGKL